jgi:hypothetical protein
MQFHLGISVLKFYVAAIQSHPTLVGVFLLLEHLFYVKFVGYNRKGSHCYDVCNC